MRAGSLLPCYEPSSDCHSAMRATSPPLEIKFYFDYRSPFSYLAKDPAYALEHDYNVKLRFLPHAFPLEQAVGLPNVLSTIYHSATIHSSAAPEVIPFQKAFIPIIGSQICSILKITDKKRTAVEKSPLRIYGRS
jgi:hypothetical protein